MPYLIWDIVKGAFLLGLAAAFFVGCIGAFLIGLLYLLDWIEEQKEYARLKRALLKRPFPKLDKERIAR